MCPKTELVKTIWLIHTIEYYAMGDYVKEWENVCGILLSTKADHKTLLRYDLIFKAYIYMILTHMHKLSSEIIETKSDYI